MFIYIAKTFNATVRGSVVKDVTCEQCGGQFFYQLARVGTGSASAPYYLGQDSAQERAQRDAQASLAAKLQVECELVPCPHCGHIQQQMIEFLRGRAYRTLLMWSWLLPAIGLFFTAMIAWIEWQSHPYRFERDHGPYLNAAAAFLCMFPLFMWLRSWLLSRPKWMRALLMVAPPALLPEGGPDIYGNVTLRPVPRQQDEKHPDEWVTFSVLRMALPAVCCECLQPSTTVYHAPFRVNDDSDSQVPLCQSCFRKINWRWWKALALTIVICLAISAAVPMLPIYGRKIDDLGRLLTGIFVGLFLTIIAAAVVPGLLTKPHRMRVVDTQRGIVRMRFRNPQYTRLLRQMVSQIDGINPGA